MLALVAVAALLAFQQAPDPLPAWQQNRAVLEAEARAGLARGAQLRDVASRDRDRVRAWQTRTREALRDRFAPLPPADRTPPAVLVTATLPRDGYRVEHLLIESRPGVHVTAHAWVPDSATADRPAPGLLLACGHARDGKSSPLYQRGAATLARSGFVTLVFDPVDQGERLQSRDVPDRWGTRAHSISGLQALLVGWNQAGLQAWDSIRCLDALATRADVDADRLGVCGNSGGGTQSAQVFALDDRLRAAAPSCYLTSFASLIDSVGPQDCEQNLPGQLRAGLDHVDYLAVRAPAPTLICAAQDDFFPIAGTRETFATATRLHAAFGTAETIELSVAQAGHGWHPELIEATAQWFARHLHGDVERAAACVAEPSLTTTADQQVVAGGRVLDLEGERSVLELIRGAAVGAARVREETPETARIALARDLCGVRPLDSLPPLRFVPASTPATELRAGLQRVEVQTLTGMLLPATWVDRRSTRDPAILAIGLGAWTGPATDANDPRRTLAASTSQQVLCLDVIALGDAEPAESPWYGAFGSLARDAALCRLIDRPLLGLQIEQILAVARELAADGARVDLHARGAAALAALHAAAFEPQLFGRIDVETPIDAWSDLLVERPLLHVLPLAVPDALECYELADLRRVVAR